MWRSKRARLGHHSQLLNGPSVFIHTTRNTLADFTRELQEMQEQGMEAAVSQKRVPRELKRGWLSLVERLGHGQFGEVRVLWLLSRKSVRRWPIALHYPASPCEKGYSNTDGVDIIVTATRFAATVLRCGRGSCRTTRRSAANWKSGKVNCTWVIFLVSSAHLHVLRAPRGVHRTCRRADEI